MREKTHRVCSQNRLLWYGRPANPQYWQDYFTNQVTPAYYESTRKLDLKNHELGKVLLQELNHSGKHLEAGCGLGYWVVALNQHGFSVEGIDFAEALIAEMKKIEPEMPVRHGNALAIDCPDETYDTYLSFGVVEHRIEGPEPFLVEAHRVIKTGGKLILSVPGFGPLRQLKGRLGCYRDDIQDEAFYQYGFSKAELLSIVEQTGYRLKMSRFIFLDRLLQEEVSFYRKLSHYSHLRQMRKLILAPFSGLDGHMLLVVGEKISRPTESTKTP
jgi:SAM-dependent methyltransferase